LSSPSFEESIFINCPFDEEYAPILQAIAFCVTYLGFFPRLAPENADNGRARLDRIIDLVQGSKYAIHDLSRCKPKDGEEYDRMNMPFELGIDHACSRFGSGRLKKKTILILEQNRFDYQKALSDISGWDIQFHDGSHQRAMSRVRNWLVQQGAKNIGTAQIRGKYADFLQWYWNQQLAAGSSPEDIKEYPTDELIRAMRKWMEAGQPLNGLFP